MAAKLDYRWHLRQVMATRDMFQTTDLIAPLADRGIELSSSQVYRLVAERPEGRKVYYRAQPEGLAPLVDWMSHYGVFWRERFADLRTLLKEIDP